MAPRYLNSKTLPWRPTHGVGVLAMIPLRMPTELSGQVSPNEVEWS